MWWLPCGQIWRGKTTHINESFWSLFFSMWNLLKAKHDTAKFPQARQWPVSVELFISPPVRVCWEPACCSKGRFAWSPKLGLLQAYLKGVGWVTNDHSSVPFSKRLLMLYKTRCTHTSVHTQTKCSVPEWNDWIFMIHDFSFPHHLSCLPPLFFSLPL